MAECVARAAGGNTATEQASVVVCCASTDTTNTDTTNTDTSNTDLPPGLAKKQK